MMLRDVALWPKADMPRQLGDVCFRMKSGHTDVTLPHRCWGFSAFGEPWWRQGCISAAG